MKHQSVDIFAVIVMALIAVFLVFVIPADNAVARVWALPLVFLLPGYALVCALFSRQTLSILDCFIFSLGLSLSIVLLGGLILNLTPFGLRAQSWAVFLSSITIGASAIGLIRRRGQVNPVTGWSIPGSFGFTLRQGILMGLAVVIIGIAIAVSIFGAQQQPFPGFTQLWLLPVGQANTTNTVRLGVRNMEHTSMKYRLVVDENGKPVKVWAAINVNQNGTWQATLVFSETVRESSTKVEAMLYREDAPAKVYRDVVLWLGP